MKPKSVKWGEHPWEEIKQIAESGAVAVAPFGSTEQHGPMLPVDTDIRIAEKVANDGAETAVSRYGIPVLVMPTMPFGLALHHNRASGWCSPACRLLLCTLHDGLHPFQLLPAPLLAYLGELHYDGFQIEEFFGNTLDERLELPYLPFQCCNAVIACSPAC